MFSRTARSLSALFVSLLLLSLFVTPTSAQTNAGIVTLADLGKTEIRLDGPFDSETLTFGIPASWRINSGGNLSLEFTAVFTQPAIADVVNNYGGTLTVSFNRRTLAVVPVAANDSNFVFDIPAEWFVSPRSDGRMELRVELDSGISCLANNQMNLIISQDTSFTLSYAETEPETNLLNFPYPLYQDSIFPDFAYIVIPDQPTSAELRSALTVAAGLGNLTSSELALDLLRAGELTDELRAAANLIFVGKASSLPDTTELGLPVPMSGGTFSVADEDFGVTEMVVSPWNRKNVVLVVSGNSDLAVTKSAQALSTGRFIPNVSPSVAVIEDVQAALVSTPLVYDQTLADMGFDEQQFEGRGVESDSYSFFVPSGNVVTSDAYFELSYAHSALLNYNLSGMVILLNGNPVGSVRFTDETSKVPTNKARFSLPPSIIHPGNNNLEVRASLEPVENCVDPNLRGLWTIVWPDSRFFIPFSPSQSDGPVFMDLGLYPAPMTFDSSLETTAFVFQRDNSQSWRHGIQIAAFLGDRSNGPISKPMVFFDDEINTADLSPYNIIVMGRPSQLSIINTVAEDMPASFDTGSDFVREQFSHIVYEIPENASIGYVELLPSPWNNEKVLITALGGTPEAQGWAGAALYDPILLSGLSGNYAVITGAQDIQTLDTRVSLPSSSTQGGAAATPGAAPEPAPEPSPELRPSWVLPALQISGVVTLLLLAALAFANWRRARRNRS